MSDHTRLWDWIWALDLPSSAFKTYMALRWHMGYYPANPEYMRAWPSIGRLCKLAHKTRSTIKRDLDYLEKRFLIAIDSGKKRGKVSYYYFLDNEHLRSEFEENVRRYGPRKALDCYVDFLEETIHEAQAEEAENAQERRPRKGPKRPSKRVAEERTRGGRETAHPVAEESATQVARKRTTDLVVVGSLGSDPMEVNTSSPPTVSDVVSPLAELSKGKDKGNSNSLSEGKDNGHSNGQDAPRETTRHRCDPKGDLRNRYLSSCDTCKEYFWDGRFNEEQLRSMGFRPSVLGEVSS